ncbi:sterol desaturase family protein [Daejeonella sp.]|uniref:sterol desaturase family protein n=1 Tax=Daejeonella sp. TaxID=2805397 RepID=UPI0030C52B68
MDEIRLVFDIKGGLALMIVFVVLFVCQQRWKLRRPTQSVFKRTFTNVLVSMPSFVLLRFVFLPLMVGLAIRNEDWQWGLLYVIDIDPYIKTLIAFLFLDYTNYCWHILNHKLPVLWRFHVVHHSDPDLDVSTALRFHFGELIGSVFFRGAFVLLSGASPLQVLLYEVVFEAATQFHHSNWKLPYRFEKILNWLIVTPRMHGIHHSVIKNETDSNYSVIFSFWDRLHRTIRVNIHQDEILTGVPSYHDPAELTVPFLLKMPFTRIRPWPKDLNARPERKPASGEDMLKG